MRLAALFSGGKDSTAAIWKAREEGHDVTYIVTAFPKSQESYMFHYANVKWTRLQASMMVIKQIVFETEGRKEEELNELKQALQGLDVDGVLSGALASNYQKQRIDRICDELKLKHISPLWGKDPEKYLRELVNTGFEAIITSISAQGFDESWLGRLIDEKCIDDLLELRDKYGILITGEGGEYCSFVLNCPLFSKKLEVTEAHKKMEGENRGYYMITGLEEQR